MRPLLTLAVILAFPPAAFAAPAPAAASERADWRRDGVDDRVKAGLTSLGWRLEDDGRALDPKTKAPVSKAAADAREIEKIYQSGADFYAKGEYGKAADAFRRILTKDPQNTQAKKALERIIRLSR